MAAISANRVGEFLNNPPGNIRAILVHGSDRGLVSERAGLLAQKFVGQDAGELALTRLTAGDLEEDRGRLADEATSLGLFGGRRAIRVRPERIQIADLLQDLLERIGGDILVVVETGQLAATAKLRKIFESSPLCAALPCYSDDARDLGPIITAHPQEYDLTIDPDAAMALAAQLGGDRQATRSELDKLALYCLNQERVSLEDVQAVASNSAHLNIDDLCDHVGLGHLGEADQLIQRLLGSAITPDRILAGVSRHFLLLHELRGAIEAGARADAMVAGFRPPIFFKRKAAITDQCRVWRLSDLNRALEIIGRAELQIRSGAGLGGEIVSTALLAICAKAASLARR